MNNSARRSPRGERGLKWFLARSTSIVVNKSLPPRGAWIEIRWRNKRVVRNPSLPPRGAWIEIGMVLTPSNHVVRSLPPRGAWIEITKTRIRSKRTSSRSPRGERGLKSSGAAVVSPKCRPLSVRIAVTESPTRYIQPSLTASLLRPALYCPKIRRKSDVCGGFFVFCGVLLPFFTK